MAQWARGLAPRLEYEAGRALRDSLDIVQASAEEHSSGPHSSADLRRAGHPYSRRRPRRRRFPPEVINVQTGEFRAAWTQEVGREGRDWVGAVYNTDPKGPGLEHGTERMIRRPLVRAVTAATADRVAERFERAIEDALT